MVTSRKCSYYDGVEGAKQDPQIVEEMLDIEELEKLGKYHDACPFYLERELEKSADIIFMPYNYLVDSSTRASLNINLENSILIFDEAHNLVVKVL